MDSLFRDFVSEASRDDEFVGLERAEVAGQRDESEAVARERLLQDAGVARRSCANELIECDLVGPGERKQLIEGGPALSGLQSRKCADGNACGRCELSERDASLLAQ